MGCVLSLSDAKIGIFGAEVHSIYIIFLRLDL